jgi:hypothetical protein
MLCSALPPVELTDAAVVPSFDLKLTSGPQFTLPAGMLSDAAVISEFLSLTMNAV